MTNLPLQTDTQGMTTLSLRLPSTMQARLRAASEQTGASQATIIRAALQKYLDELHPIQSTSL